MRRLFVAGLLACIAPFAPRIDARVDPIDTKLLTQPAISASHIAFIYAGDLFTCDLNGGNVRRLTTDDGVEANPVFAPDGKTIAFSAQYDGNVDVYTVPVTGGAPTRLTWHPGADQVQSFTPDGTAVLFASQRATFTGRYAQLFTVPVAGGIEEALPIPNAARATYSPDGQRIAYNPLSGRYQQWKQYRGGTVSRLWLYNTKGHAIEKIPQPASRANDTDPMWIGDTVFFRSDRSGEFNVPMGRYAKPAILDTACLYAASQALARADLRCTPFESLLSEARPGDFVYLDPPYEPVSRTANFTSYAQDGFSQESQRRLRDVFRELDRRGSKLMLSNSDVPFIRELYRGYRIDIVKAPRAVSCDEANRGPVNGSW